MQGNQVGIAITSETRACSKCLQMIIGGHRAGRALVDLARIRKELAKDIPSAGTVAYIVRKLLVIFCAC